MNRKIVGNNIKRIRKERGLSQSELASLMGYKDHSTLAKVETGVNDITVETLYKYSQVLNVSINDLLTESKNNQSISKNVTKK